MGPHSDSLAATVMREAEEELQWAREKSRPSPLLTASGTSGSFDFPSPSMTPMPMHPSMDVESGSGSALPFAPGLRGAGSVFLTKYGRGRSGSEPSMSPRRSPATESPDKSTFHVPTPGPGSYEITAQNSITSILRSNSDKAQPAFRSTSNRFRGPERRFVTSDPLHLEPGSKSKPRDMAPFVKASPVAFRRGNSAVMTTLG